MRRSFAAVMDRLIPPEDAATRADYRTDHEPWPSATVVEATPRVCVDDEAWRDAAACRGCDPDLFFPAKGDVATERAAKAVCAGCPVRAECLEWALVHIAEPGVLGGTLHKERRRIRKQRREVA